MKRPVRLLIALYLLPGIALPSAFAGFFAYQAVSIFSGPQVSSPEPIRLVLMVATAILAPVIAAAGYLNWAFSAGFFRLRNRLVISLSFSIMGMTGIYILATGKSPWAMFYWATFVLLLAYVIHDLWTSGRTKPD